MPTNKRQLFWLHYSTRNDLISDDEIHTLERGHSLQVSLENKGIYGSYGYKVEIFSVTLICLSRNK